MTDSRLPILKALGDNTRYAIYLELARSPRPLSTSDIAESLALHPNTVRPHLERMRDVGLLDVRTDGTGGVGRPQHLYALAADAPSLGLEPPTYPLLARMLLETAAAAGVAPDEAAEIGRAAGPSQQRPLRRRSVVPRGPRPRARRARVRPGGRRVDDGEIAVIGFAHCPFRELAEAHPELVCSLHRGMVEGFVEQTGEAAVDDFHTARPPRTLSSQLISPDGSMATVITLTDSAAAKSRSSSTPRAIRRSRSASPCGPAAARASPTRCSSTPTWRSDDEQANFGDVKVIVDPSSAQLLTGATLDYKDGLQQAGFAIDNPNATRTCGCGQSFS